MRGRRRHLWAASAALCVYGVAYLVAWSFVWAVAPDDRDGLEAGLVLLLTLPWCVLPVGGGYAVVHVGAVINGSLFALLVGSIVGRPRRGKQ